MMIKVSPSLIGYLRECPRCLWYYFNEDIKRPRGIFPSLPGGMDEILKNYFDSYRAKNQLPPEIDNKVDEKLYSDLEKLEKMRNNFKGLSADFPEFNLRLKGAIDELLVNNSREHVVFDFKTRGYPIKEDTHRHYQDQLDLYALLLNENKFKVADYGYLLFFYPKDFNRGKASFSSQLVKMDVSRQAGLKVLQDVDKILNGPKPKSHSDCEYCLYQSSLIDSLSQ